MSSITVIIAAPYHWPALPFSPSMPTTNRVKKKNAKKPAQKRTDRKIAWRLPARDFSVFI
jgi:hypothetical protein